MEKKEVIREGEAFERLIANEDYAVAQEFVQRQIQSASSTILGPDGPTTLIKDFEDYKKQKGILLGLAMLQSYMENVVVEMKVIKEEMRKAELEKRKEEEAKLARTK